METLPLNKQKLDRRKQQDFKEDGLNSPKGIQVYEVLHVGCRCNCGRCEDLTASSEYISVIQLNIFNQTNVFILYTLSFLIFDIMY